MAARSEAEAILGISGKVKSLSDMQRPETPGFSPERGSFSSAETIASFPAQYGVKPATLMIGTSA
jgi:hypothetical protein